MVGVKGIRVGWGWGGQIRLIVYYLIVVYNQIIDR
jgi:hypothetical protein